MLLHNRYEILETLGEGSIGRVVKAMDIQLSEEVAVKELTTNGDIKELEQKVVESVRSFRKLKSKVLASVYDVFVEDSNIYIVNELGNNLTLREHLKAELSENEREKLAVAIIKAAATLHEDGVVHGDISTDNILIGKDLKITFIDPLFTSSFENRNNQYAGISGTAKYMAPELFHPAYSPSLKTDVYSIGSVVFEVLKNCPPVEGNTFVEIAFNATQLQIDVESNLLPTYPSYIVSGIKKALSSDPSQRFNDCRHFCNYLSKKSSIVHSKRIFKVILPIVILIILSAVTALPTIKYFEKKQRGYWKDMVDVPSDLLIHLPDSAIIRLPNIGKAPFYLRPSKNGSGLLSCNSHSPYISVLKTENRKVNLESKISLGQWHCQDLEYVGDDKLLLSDPVDNAILLMDLQDNKILHIFSNSETTRYFLHPDAIAVTRDGKKAVVGNWKGGTVTIINIAKRVVDAVVPVYGGPSGIAITPDDKYAFVSHTDVRYNPSTNETEGLISVINLSSNKLIKEISNVGKASADIKILPDGQTAVTANNRGPTLSFIDITGMSKINDLNLYNGSPVDIAISPSTSLMFVANYNHPFIHIVDYKAKAIKAVLFSKYFGKETNGICLSPDESLICITNTAIGEVNCVANPSKQF